MMLEVLVFGPAALAAGADKVGVSVPESAAAGDVIAALHRHYPSLRFALESARLAVNHAFVSTDAPISATDELALISLVGGG